MIIIEGEEIEITSQKIMPRIQLPEERYTINGDKVIVFPFSLSIHGDGEIKMENSIKDQNGRTTARFDQTAILAVGSTAAGKKLWGFSKKKMGKITVGASNARTGAHPCQSTRIRECCYLNVFETYLSITDLVHPQELYKEPQRRLSS